MLDPRTWKREHRIAALSAVALGALIGMAVGVQSAPTHYWPRDILWLSLPGGHDLDLGYSLRLAAWTLFGATIGGAVVYIRQLLRS